MPTQSLSKRNKNLPQKIKKTKLDSPFLTKNHPYKPKKNKFKEYKRQHSK